MAEKIPSLQQVPSDSSSVLKQHVLCQECPDAFPQQSQTLMLLASSLFSDAQDAQFKISNCFVQVISEMKTKYIFPKMNY